MPGGGGWSVSRAERWNTRRAASRDSERFAPTSAWVSTSASSGCTRRSRCRVPARLHYRLERWVSGRWFDDLKAATEWDVILKYDVLGKKYQAVRVVGGK